MTKDGKILLSAQNQSKVPETFDNEVASNAKFRSDYEGNKEFDDPTPEGGFTLTGLDFPNPFLLLCFFDPAINQGKMLLHPWQMEDLESIATGQELTYQNPDAHKQPGSKPTSQHPYKYCLLAANGSGKDKFILAPFAIWFALTKIRSRCIITTSSGTQLTSQTEPYIKDLAEKVNNYFGHEVFRIRQRYIKCLQTGSEIRLFATDEAGKAEGYHPIDADSEMAIIENEAKSISPEINQALRRCSGFNYWLKVSSAGPPAGHLYEAFKRWKHTRRVTSYDCPHVSKEEIQEDLETDGQHSVFFRSKHLSLFTSIDTTAVISVELVQKCLDNPPPEINLQKDNERIGIDLAAGGAETVVCIARGNRCKKEYAFKEKDTTISADKIEKFLLDNKISKDHKHIYADDGGVGRAIIDMLVRRGWNINRVMNQWAAVGNKKQFGNRGAENWWRVARIIEEGLWDLSSLSPTTREQLYNRCYKQSSVGKIYLQDKKDAISHGYPSPDRADAYILSQTGLTLDDYQKALSEGPNPRPKPKEKEFTTNEALSQWHNDEKFKQFEETHMQGTKINNSLQVLLGRN